MALSDQQIHDMWEEPVDVRPAGVLTCTTCNRHLYFPIMEHPEESYFYVDGDIECPCGQIYKVANDVFENGAKT